MSQPSASSGPPPEDLRQNDPAKDSADAPLRLEPLAHDGPASPAWRKGRRGGVALAAGLVILTGLLVALAARSGPEPAPSETTLGVEVAAPAPPPEPVADGAPLDVLPADMAAAAAPAPPAPLEAPPAPESDDPTRLAEAPAPQRPTVEGDEPRFVSLPPAQQGPSLDCRSARSRAERMVCADPALAEADQRLGEAYRAALAAGVPDWRLGRQQRRWLQAREAAAHEAPYAVAGVYEARIEELRAMVGGPSWPPSW